MEIFFAHFQSEEARDILASVILSHIPVEYYNFRLKAIYICHMIRQIIQVSHSPETIDDKDYYGNKRIELYVRARFLS